MNNKRMSDMPWIPNPHRRPRRSRLRRLFTTWDGIGTLLQALAVQFIEDLAAAWAFMLAVGIAHIHTGTPPVPLGFWDSFIVLVLLQFAFAMSRTGGKGDDS